MFKLGVALAVLGAGASARGDGKDAPVPAGTYSGMLYKTSAGQMLMACQEMVLDQCTQNGSEHPFHTKLTKNAENDFVVKSCTKAGCECDTEHTYQLDALVPQVGDSESQIKIEEGRNKECAKLPTGTDIFMSQWDGKLAAAVALKSEDKTESRGEREREEKKESLLQIKSKQVEVKPAKHALEVAEENMAYQVSSLTHELRKLESRFLEPSASQHSKWVLPDGQKVVLADALKKDETEVVPELKIEHKDGDTVISDWGQEYGPIDAKLGPGKDVTIDGMSRWWMVVIGVLALFLVVGLSYWYMKGSP